MLAVLLVLAPALPAEYCNASRQRGFSASRPHCSHSVHLYGRTPQIICVQNAPFRLTTGVRSALKARATHARATHAAPAQPPSHPSASPPRRSPRRSSSMPST